MTDLGIITSSVVNPGDAKRLCALDEWATALTGSFGLLGVSTHLVHHIQEEPQGFAAGMNQALKDLRAESRDPLFLLCINDDLHPSHDCISQLWQHRQLDYVVCPTTDATSCPEQAAAGPYYQPVRKSPFVPAICWLIPWAFVKTAMHKLGNHQLFDESLGRAWYEDNLTAKIWQKLHNPLPFMIAPLAWAHHEGSRTSNLIPEAERYAAKARYEERVKELDL